MRVGGGDEIRQGISADDVTAPEAPARSGGARAEGRRPVPRRSNRRRRREDRHGAARPHQDPHAGAAPRNFALLIDVSHPSLSVSLSIGIFLYPFRGFGVFFGMKIRYILCS